MFRVTQNRRRERFLWGGIGRSVFSLAAAVSALAQTSSIPAAQDFGSISVSATSAAVSISYSFTGLSNAPVFSLAYSGDFSSQTPACTVGATTTCSVAVKFSPKYAGLRVSALIVKNQSGTLLGSTLLHGIGLAPEMALSPGIISTVAGSGSPGYSGDGQAATSATLWNPQGVAIDAAGNLYIPDSINQVIRKVTAATGNISTVAGMGFAPGSSGDGGAATSAKLNNPTGVAVDGVGNLYIADQGNGRIREVNAVTGIITTVAGGGNGQGAADRYGDGGAATNAILSGPNDVAVDALGNLYIADSFHGLVREVTASTGLISIVAGGGQGGGSDGLGDGAAATNAILDNPTGVAVDSAGNVYIADSGHCMIREVNTSGTISAIAGTGNAGYSGDLGPATAAELTTPTGVRVDAAGNIYISDAGANVIREVTVVSGMIRTIAGSGSSGYAGDNGSAVNAAIANPQNLALDPAGNLYIADLSNNVVRKVAVGSSTLSFPATDVGQASAAQLVTVSNIGTQNLNFSGLSVSANFRQQSSGYSDCSSSSVVAAGSACMAAIASVPTTSGPLNGTLTVTGNSLNVANTSKQATLTGTGNVAAVPQASISPASLAFGSQNVGLVSAAKTVTLSNTGTAALNILSIWLTGTNTGDFGISTTCGSVLAASSSCTVSVTFSPTATGSRSATLMFTDSVASSPQSVALSGTGTQTAGASFSAASLSFASQAVGTASAPATVTLTNTGTGALGIYSVSLSGANAADFTMSTSCGSSLAAGASCGVTVSFAPAAAGTRSASLTFSDSAASSPQSISLTGTGTQVAGAILNPTNISFPSTNTGSSSSPIAVTLTNNGSGALSIFSIWLSGANAADFTMNTTCGTSLNAGASCTVSLTFTPTGAGVRSATLSVNDSAPTSSQTSAIAGTGAAPDPPPPSLSFTNVPGALAQLSVGADGTVWGLNAGGEIYQRNAATQSWAYVPGSLAQLFVGSSAAVWGLNSGGQIYRWNASAQAWDSIPGALAQLAVGCDGDVWGINSGGSVYHFNAETKGWQQIPGTLAQIAVGFDGAVWGLNGSHSVYRFNEASQSFVATGGTLTQLAIGADGDAWGLNNQSIFHFDQRSQSWQPMAGSLAQLAVGAGGVVYGRNAANQVCQYNAAAQSCNWISPSLVKLAAGANGAVWGLDSSGGIWVLNAPTAASGALHEMPGAMAQLSAASDGSVWAVNSAGLIFQFNAATQSWNSIAGSLAHVAIGPNGDVWGLNSSGQIFHFEPSSQSWIEIPGSLAQIAVGGNGSVWGLNAGGQIYSLNSATQGWTWVPGTLAQLTLGADGSVWGLNAGGQSYRFNASTQKWQWFQSSLAQIAAASATNVWGLGPQGQVYQFDAQNGAWRTMPGSFAHLSVGFDGAVWATDASHNVFRFNAASGSWDQIAGSLAQIAVAADAVIWGLDGSGGVYHFQ